MSLILRYDAIVLRLADDGLRLLVSRCSEDSVELAVGELLRAHFGNLLSSDWLVHELLLHLAIVLSQVRQALQAVSVLLLLGEAHDVLLMSQVPSLLIVQFLLPIGGFLGLVACHVAVQFRSGPWLLAHWMALTLLGWHD